MSTNKCSIWYDNCNDCGNIEVQRFYLSIACPTEINVYSKADPTSKIRNTIPNGSEFTITSYTSAFDTNWGHYVNDSNLNCFVDLSFCKFVE